MYSLAVCVNPLHLDDISEPEADIAILRPRGDFYTSSHRGPADVLLVIEVADTSPAFDLGTKVPLYAGGRVVVELSRLLPPMA